jgi:uncharacterized membrane protein
MTMGADAAVELTRRHVSGRILSARRWLVCLVLGAAAGVLTGLWSPRLAPTAGWTVTATVAIAWVWWIGWPQGAAGTKRLAEEEGRSRSTDVWVLSTSVASLAAVVLALSEAGGRSAVAIATVIVSLLSVAASWALVNTVFALKYARLYYLDEPDRGGFDFKQEDNPAYSDFAYLAFTVGMTFAVSETEPTQTQTRKVALGHALLSYLFGTGVLAAAVNLVTNLGGG